MGSERAYTNELAALTDYIAQFIPEDFSTTAPLDSLAQSPERLGQAERLKARLRRKRQLALALHERLEHEGFTADEAILTQAEVDALLADWS